MTAEVMDPRNPTSGDNSICEQSQPNKPLPVNVGALSTAPGEVLEGVQTRSRVKVYMLSSTIALVLVVVQSVLAL